MFARPPQPCLLSARTKEKYALTLWLSQQQHWLGASRFVCPGTHWVNPPSQVGTSSKTNQICVVANASVVWFACRKVAQRGSVSGMHKSAQVPANNRFMQVWWRAFSWVPYSFRGDERGCRRPTLVLLTLSQVYAEWIKQLGVLQKSLRGINCSGELERNCSHTDNLHYSGAGELHVDVRMRYGALMSAYAYTAAFFTLCLTWQVFIFKFHSSPFHVLVMQKHF